MFLRDHDPNEAKKSSKEEEKTRRKHEKNDEKWSKKQVDNFMKNDVFKTQNIEFYKGNHSVLLKKRRGPLLLRSLGGRTGAHPIYETRGMVKSAF